MGWTMLAAKVADALSLGVASETMIILRIGVEGIPTEVLRACLISMSRRGVIERVGIEWRLIPTRIECKKCHDAKLPDEFHNNSKRPNGKQPWCKKCMCAVVRELYQRKKRQRQSFEARAITENRAHV